MTLRKYLTQDLKSWNFQCNIRQSEHGLIPLYVFELQIPIPLAFVAIIKQFTGESTYARALMVATTHIEVCLHFAAIPWLNRMMIGNSIAESYEQICHCDIDLQI